MGTTAQESILLPAEQDLCPEAEEPLYLIELFIPFEIHVFAALIKRYCSK